MEKNLEEIFWEDGKFVDGKGNQVNPKPIGEPQLFVGYQHIKEKNMEALIYGCTDSLFLLKLKEQKELEFNAFLMGKENKTSNDDTAYYGNNVPIQLYKI